MWLTEFACAYHDEDANLVFMKDILPKLEALPATVLARYAWCVPPSLPPTHAPFPFALQGEMWRKFVLACKPECRALSPSA